MLQIMLAAFWDSAKWALPIPFVENWFAVVLSCFVELCARENSVHPSGSQLSLNFSLLRDRWVSCKLVVYHGVFWSARAQHCSEPKCLLAALSGLFLRAEAHSVLRFRRGLALLDLGLLLRAIGLLLRDAAFHGGGSGQRCAVGAVLLHSVGIC